MKTFVYLSLAVLMVFLTACNLTFTFPTGTPSPTSASTPTSASAFAWPAGSGACTLLTTESTVLYDRPSSEAQIFSEVEADFSAVVTGRTVDGWVGFDPGVAQAANIGIFRLRWAHFDDVTLRGDCVSEPEAGWVPQPDLCYTMPMESVTVYTGANTTASVLATLDVEDFAALIGLTDGGWAQVDLGAGNTGLEGIGWMEQSTLNVNGGTCDELPTVSP